MYACNIFLMDDSKTVVDCIRLMMPNIPRLGELITVHNTYIYKAVVIQVANIYFHTPEQPKHETFETHTVVDQNSCYFHITVKNQDSK